MTVPTEGETQTIERTFTREDVEQFAAVSGDDQPRHTEPDEDGRVMVQGLLTATLPTSIGSDNEVLASLMEFRFRRPVYTGQQITCRSTYETVDEYEDRYEMTSTLVCENDDGETVMTGTVEGILHKD